MIIEDGKVICIKSFYLSSSKENTEGKQYYYYILDDSGDSEYDGIWVDSNDDKSSTYFDLEQFNQHFIKLAEWRDKQINSIFE